ncbi:MAG: BrnT family toxin [Alphaproteobacteria bacterium]|nr:BrnT family toxin [Alphaproteobacteria bacterium]
MFEWEEARRAANLSTQGVDFVRVARMFDNPVLEREDDRQFHGEKRYIAIGFADGMYLVAVWAPRGVRRRLLAAWRADRDDEEHYRAAVPAATRAYGGPYATGRAATSEPWRRLLAGGSGRLSLPRPEVSEGETGS